MGFWATWCHCSTCYRSYSLLPVVESLYSVDLVECTDWSSGTQVKILQVSGLLWFSWRCEETAGGLCRRFCRFLSSLNDDSLAGHLLNERIGKIAAAGAEYLGHGCECYDRKFLQGREVDRKVSASCFPAQIPTKALTEILLSCGGVCINIRYLQVIVFFPFL